MAVMANFAAQENEKFLKAFQLISNNISILQEATSLPFFDALIEQNAFYTGKNEDETEAPEAAAANNKILQSLKLNQQDWQKLFQYLFLKGNQIEPLTDANQSFTPDSIGLLISFIIRQLKTEKTLSIIELGSGMGNLAAFLALSLAADKTITYTGLEVDDLLIDLAASCGEVMELENVYFQADAVKPLHLEPADVVVSDLPIGYYPDNAVIADTYEVKAENELTYAHHLLIERGLNLLKEKGLAIFTAPLTLLSSPQAGQLKKMLDKKASIRAVITLPEALFTTQAKAVYVLSKIDSTHATHVTHAAHSVNPTFAYPLTDLTDKAQIAGFVREFTKNVIL